MNIILPITTKAELDGIDISKLKTKYKNANLVFGITENLKDDFFKGEKVIVFGGQTSKEEMITVLFKNVKGKTVVVRDFSFLDNINELVSKNADVCMFKQKVSAFKNWIFSLISKFTGIIFGYNLYEGNSSVIFFNENITDLIKTLPRHVVSLSTRVDRFVGAKIEYVETDKEFSYKPKYNPKNQIITGGVMLLLMAVCITMLAVFGEFFSGQTILMLLMVFVALLFLVLAIYQLIKMIILFSLGSLSPIDVEKIHTEEEVEKRTRKKTSK